MWDEHYENIRCKHINRCSDEQFKSTPDEQRIKWWRDDSRLTNKIRTDTSKWADKGVHIQYLKKKNKFYMNGWTNAYRLVDEQTNDQIYKEVVSKWKILHW